MTPQQEAAQILGEVVRELTSSSRDLKLALRKCLHASELVDHEPGRLSIEYELEGYPQAVELPVYRRIPGLLNWQVAGFPDKPSDSILTRIVAPTELARLTVDQTTLEVRAGIDWVMTASLNGYSEHTAETTIAKTEKGFPLDLVRVKVFEPLMFTWVLNRLEHTVLQFASKSYRFLQYGEALTDIWQAYRQQVDAKIRDLNFGSHLDAIQSDIRSPNSQDWRQAAYGCRNLIEDLARHLWRDPRATYDLLPGQAKNGKLQVTNDKYLNRISAYLHQEMVTKSSDELLHAELDRLDASIRALASDASSGHGPISHDDARQLVLATYFILGALVTKTEMVPIESYRQLPQGAS